VTQDDLDFSRQAMDWMIDIQLTDQQRGKGRWGRW
jgi:hypothetical protein